MSDESQMAAQIKALPRNKAGYPIPWFVDRRADVAGQPDFRVMDSRRLVDAIRFKLCWVCGQPRGQFGSFVVGPMCAVNRTSGEPPCHRPCAVYSATHCPFLTRPSMTRRDKHLPEGHYTNPGAILRNPGVALVWTSRTFSHYTIPSGPLGDGGGILFDMGEPTGMSWWCEGREASPDEILASIDSGLPNLLTIAEHDGPEGVAAVRAKADAVRALVLA